MPTPLRPLVIYVDVDDTLVRSFGSKQVPITAVIERVRLLAAEPGTVLYCWSSGGAAYAESVATTYGVAGCFAAFLPKPNVMLDDVRPGDWKDLIAVHPNEAGELEGATARARLGWG